MAKQPLQPFWLPWLKVHSLNSAAAAAIADGTMHHHMLQLPCLVGLQTAHAALHISRCFFMSSVSLGQVSVVKHALPSAPSPPPPPPGARPAHKLSHPPLQGYSASALNMPLVAEQSLAATRPQCVAAATDSLPSPRFTQTDSVLMACLPSLCKQRVSRSCGPPSRRSILDRSQAATGLRTMDLNSVLPARNPLQQRRMSTCIPVCGLLGILNRSSRRLPSTSAAPRMTALAQKMRKPAMDFPRRCLSCSQAASDQQETRSDHQA